MNATWKNVIGTVAPTIAKLLGGPLAGGVVEKLGNALLGKPDATEDELAAAVAKADPEMLLKLKTLDAEYQQHMADLGIEIEKIDAGDRADARKRQVEMRDWTPNVLGGVVLAGYFTIQWFVLTHPLLKENNDVIMRTLGTLDAIVMTVVAYFFGSSQSSRKKDDTIKAMSDKK